MKVRWKWDQSKRKNERGQFRFERQLHFFSKHGVFGGVGGGVSSGQEGMEWDCICSWVFFSFFLVSPHDDSKVVCISGPGRRGGGGGLGIFYRIFTPS